ncbi:MAG: Fe-S cluster assembly protein SufD [Deltaproteobacteria bacterium]|nr:Fe-S cluster assembly protein SufD [Deltaproteobacteria bacterium]
MSTFLQQLEKDSQSLMQLWNPELRQKAYAAFLNQGLPSTKLESWRYTSLQKMAELPFESKSSVHQAELPSLEKRCRITLINGQFSREHSSLHLPAGVEFKPLSEALKNGLQLEALATTPENALNNLNTAFFLDGAYLRISANTQVEEVLEILCIQDASHLQAFYPKNVIELESAAYAHVQERYISLHHECYLMNASTEIKLGDNAELHYYRSQEEDKKAFHLSSVRVSQKRNSRFYSYGLFLGSGLNHNHLQSSLKEEGAECNLLGLYLGGETQHLDNYTLIDHATPHCRSNELYKGILEEEASASFQGHILVQPHAVKTESRQLNKNLLLSPKASVNTKPLLEIYNNDVKCNHGATIGKLDEKQLFYLRSRGLDAQEAKSLLTLAFASDWLSEIKQDLLFKEFRCRILTHFFPKTVLSPLP